MSAPELRNFEPKEPVTLAQPKDDPISVEHLGKCNGKYIIYSIVPKKIHAVEEILDIMAFYYDLIHLLTI